MNKNFFKKCLFFCLSLLITFCIGIFIFFTFSKVNFLKDFFIKAFEIIKPMLYGILIAYILRPICNFCNEKFLKLFSKFKKIKKKEKLALVASITCSLITLLLTVTLLLNLIIPQLAESIPLAAQQIIDKTNEIIEYAENQSENQVVIQIGDFLEKNNVELKLDSIVQKYITPYIENIIEGLYNGVFNVIIFAKNLLLGLVVATYLLANKRKLGQQIKLIIYSLLPKKWADLLFEELIFGDKAFNGFFIGKVVDSFIIGILTFVSLSILQMPFTPLISVVVGVTNIIPFFGPFFGAVPSIILILVESPLKAFIFAIFILILQQLDGNVIGPKILGNTTGVSSFWVLISILLFGGFFGVLGMIIGVPTFAIIYDIVKKIVYQKLNKKQEIDLIKKYNNEFHSKEKED